MIASLEQITKYYGAELILDHVSLKIEDQDRIGLIGVNGAGKSTLLNILSGDLEFESGERAITSGVRIGFLRQNSGLDRSSTILAEMRSVFAPLYEIERQMEAMRIRMRQFPDDHTLLEEYNRLHTEFEAGDGYLIDVKINTILNGMGFAGRDRETLISALSGGEKTRLALCKLLLEEPELLILDEPTNHLDIETTEWLEQYLKQYEKAVVMVSHDRFFLDRTAEVVYELEDGHLTRYPGNYTHYKEEKRNADLGIVYIEDFCGKGLVKEVDQRAHTKGRNDGADADILNTGKVAVGNGGKAAADQQSDGHHGHIRQHPHPFVRQLGEAAEHKAQGVIRANADVGREEQATGKAENEDTDKEKGDSN